jgi:hypothetical protein
MFAILTVLAVFFLLIAAIGTPYGQTWAERWHG